ncbi:Membrane transport protein - like 10 [Theobroma cacao]|nr:Membrane transport protein - like 10 [Theobroma cacao]
MQPKQRMPTNRLQCDLQSTSARGILNMHVTTNQVILTEINCTRKRTKPAAHSYAFINLHLPCRPQCMRRFYLRAVFYVFNPALVASNLAETITYESMVKLWFMPFNVLLTFVIGSILGWIVIQFTRPPSHLRGLILGCCAAGNMGNMLLIIIPAVCKEKGSPFGSPEVCHSYGMGYVSLSMADLLVSEENENGYILPCTSSKGKAEYLPLQQLERDGAIPALTLIVGGNLLKGLRGSGIRKSIIFGIIVARYIALPLIGIVIVKGASRIGFVQADALYQFVLLLQFAVPPAMNIGTITQLFGAGESECSVIMLWTYALASISLTLWSTFFMWLVA